jgi:hypothetical protein
MPEFSDGWLTGSDLPTVQTSSKIRLRRGLKTVKTVSYPNARNLTVRGSTVQIPHNRIPVLTDFRNQLNSFLLKLYPGL